MSVVLGWSLLGILFIALTAMLVWMGGVKVTLAIYAWAAVIVGFILLAVYLIAGNLS
jgi:hypothetical protein